MTVLGQGYSVRHVIGSGGSGVVYACTDPAGDIVAVKEMAHRSESVSLELQALSRLDHGNIIRLQDFFMADDKVYLVMEFVDGFDLNRYFDHAGSAGSAARNQQIMAVIPQVLSALDYLHGRGVVHGDLKPQNILVRKDGKVKVADFGLARINLPAAQDQTKEYFSGTVQYASPEQCKGARPDIRSDLYSLGVVLYEAFSGQLPFQSGNFLEILLKHIQERPRSLALVADGITTEQEQAVMTLLEKNPADRLLSARDVWKAIASRTAPHHHRVFHSAHDPVFNLHNPAFTGRSTEMERLVSILDSVSSTDQNRLLITGESGIGKSRLLREFDLMKSWEGDLFIPIRRTGQRGSLDLLLKPVLTIITRLYDALPDDEKIMLREGVGREIAALQGWECFSDPEANKTSFTRAVTRLLENIARNRKIVLLIDDISELGNLEITFLNETAGTLNNMLLIMTTDVIPGQSGEASPHWKQTLGVTAEEIALALMNDCETEAMVQSMLGTTNLPEKWISRVARSAGGNPELIQEVVQNAMDSGAIEKEAGNWVYRPGEWRYRKGDVRRKMLTRFQGMSRDARHIISVLAVSDTVNELDLIYTILEFSSNQFLDGLDEISRSGFTERSETKLQFRHRAFQELVYAKIPVQKRKIIHDRVAAVMEKRGQYGPGERAYHLARGTKPGRALPFYRDEMIRLLGLARYQECIEVADSAIAIGSRRKQDQEIYADIWNRLGVAHRAQGNIEKAQNAYETLKVISQRLQDRHLEANATFGLGGIFYSRGLNAEAKEAFLEAVEMCEVLKDRKQEARCRLGLGVCLFASDDNKEALEQARTVKQIYETLGLPIGIARSLQLMGDVSLEMEQFEDARKCNEEALSIFRKHNQPAHQAGCIINIARTFLDTGRLEKAEELLNEALAIAIQEKQAVLESFARINLGHLMVEKGEYRRAIRDIEQFCRIIEKIGLKQALANSLNLLAIAREAVGDSSVAERDFNRSLSLYRSLSDIRGEAECLRSMAETKLKRGRISESLALLNYARRMAFRKKDFRLIADIYYLLSRINRFRGRISRGERLLNLSEKIVTSLDRSYLNAQILCDKGFLLLDRRDFRNAAVCFEKAGTALKPCGTVPENLRILRGRYEIAVQNEDNSTVKQISESMDTILKELDDHAVIPCLFFRVNVPGFPFPAESQSIKLAKIILKSPVYKHSIISLFARTSVAASTSDYRKSWNLYKKSRDDADRFGIPGISHQITMILEGRHPSEPTEPDHEKSERTSIMQDQAIAPIQLFIRGSRELFATTDLNRLLTAVLDQVIAVTKAERGFLMSRDSQGSLKFKISRNIKQKDITRPAFETSRSIIDHVARSGVTYMSGDVGKEDMFREQKSVRELGLRSVLCVPLLIIPSADGSDGKHVPETEGVIYVDNSLERGLFTLTEKLLVEIVAEISSIALETFRAREEMTATKAALSLENIRLKEELAGRYRFGTLIGRGASMESIFNMIERVADSNVTILITGATGTGKEVVARVIHYNSSRKNKPFISINCAALPENLLEAELFGIEKGVATGVDARMGLVQKANGGTLFLDEIGDMSPATQAKILRMLQEREVVSIGGRKPQKVDIRVVSATNKDLKEEMKNGTFREDLYYRLNVIHVHLPRLCERKEDILPLSTHFLEKYAGEAGRKIDGFTPEAMSKMAAYDWPGNVRELENAIQRVAILETGRWVTTPSLPPDIAAVESAESIADDNIMFSVEGLNLKQHVERMETLLIEKALQQAGGIKKNAAKLLGITPRILSYYLKKHGLI